MWNTIETVFHRLFCVWQSLWYSGKIPLRMEHCREEEYMMNSGFTSNVHYMTPSMEIMKLKHYNLKDGIPQCVCVWYTTTGTIIRCFVPVTLGTEFCLLCIVVDSHSYIRLHHLMQLVTACATGRWWWCNCHEFFWKLPDHATGFPVQTGSVLCFKLECE